MSGDTTIVDVILSILISNALVLLRLSNEYMVAVFTGYQCVHLFTVRIVTCNSRATLICVITAFSIPIASERT